MVFVFEARAACREIRCFCHFVADILQKCMKISKSAFFFENFCIKILSIKNNVVSL